MAQLISSEDVAPIGNARKNLIFQRNSGWNSPVPRDGLGWALPLSRDFEGTSLLGIFARCVAAAKPSASTP
jgi:hypothetical protein